MPLRTIFGIFLVLFSLVLLSYLRHRTKQELAQNTKLFLASTGTILFTSFMFQVSKCKSELKWNTLTFLLVIFVLIPVVAHDYYYFK